MFLSSLPKLQAYQQQQQQQAKSSSSASSTQPKPPPHSARRPRTTRSLNKHDYGNPCDTAYLPRPCIDSWPALAVTNAPGGGTMPTAPTTPATGGVDFLESKPTLLLELQSFLTREFGMLTETERKIDTNRLRIYSDAMKIFTRQFRTYGSILMEIMSEYDQAIRVREQTCHEVEGLRREVLVCEKHTEEAVAKSAEDHLDRARELKLEIAAYQQQLMKSEETRNMLENELLRVRRSNDILRNEKREDTEKILSLIQAVKESEERANVTIERLARAQHDTEKLKDVADQLRVAELKIHELQERFRENVTAAEHRRMIADYEGRISQMKKDETNVRRMYATRGSQLQSLKNIVEQLTKDRQKQRDAVRTPRPDWSALHDTHKDLFNITDEEDGVVVVKSTITLVEEITEKLQTAATAKSAAETEVAKLQEEVEAMHQVAGVDDTQSNVIMARGCGRFVPKYLQAYGVVPRMRLGRKDVLNVINDFMTKRKEASQAKPLDDYLDEYLHAEYKDDAIMWAYNLYDECVKFRSMDARCDVFLRIVEGELPESIYHNSIQFAQQIKNEITLNHGQNYNRKKKLKRSAFGDPLINYFPGKSLRNLERLKDAAVTSKDSMVDVEEVVQDTSRFMDVVIQQAQQEMAELYCSIIDAVIHHATTESGMVDIHNLLVAFHSVDNEMSPEDIEQIIKLIFKDYGNQIPQNVPLQSFITLLQNTKIQRKSRPV